MIHCERDEGRGEMEEGRRLRAEVRWMMEEGRRLRAEG